MSKYTKAKEFIQDEAMEVGSSVPDSGSESDDHHSGPMKLAEPNKKRGRQTTLPKIPKKQRTENGITYEILEEPPKIPPTKDTTLYPCKSGRFRI